MEWLFGHRKTAKEIIREHQRLINRSIRELDREKMKMQNEEKKIIREIKKMAQEGQMGAAKIQAKNLVRTRNHITKFIKMRAQLQAVSLRIVTLKSTQSMSDAMRGVVRAMITMNRQVNTPAMARILMEFEKQSEFMDMKQEMMDDMIDDTMAEDGEEEEENAVINKVLDEIGIDLSQQLVDAPMGGAQQAVAASQPVASAVGVGGPSSASNNNNKNNNNNNNNDDDDNNSGGGGGGGSVDPFEADLQARLDALRGDK